MFNNRFLSICLITISIVLSGCSGGGGGDGDNGGSNGDTTPPTVSSTSPADSATDVAVGTTITAAFSEAMDVSSITTNEFTVDNGIIGQVTYDSGTNTATFTPSADLAYNTTYTATITTGATDLAGNNMASNYTWSFTTGSVSDSTPPTVSSTSPADSAADVAVTATITAAFSEAMDQSSITNSEFAVDNGVTGQVAYDSNTDTATFTPSADLAYNTTYTATITTGVTDLAGNNMASNYTWSFTTGLEPELIPPSIPAGLELGAVDSSRIDLEWNASTDNVGVAGYYIYRDGVQVGQSQGTSFSDTGLVQSTEYSYAVAAYDAAGNISDQSISEEEDTYPGSINIPPPTPPIPEPEFSTILFTDGSTSGTLFTANDVENLYIQVSWNGGSGDYQERVEVYTPEGTLYQRFDEPFTAGSGTDVTVSLPIAGSYITRHAIFGQWTVEVYLGDDSTPAATANFTLQ